MQQVSRRGRIGWVGWTLIVLALLAAALLGAWRYAMATNAVALLDAGDLVLGGANGARLAAENVRFGPDPAQHVDVMVPTRPASGPRPVLVFIHGGSWASGAPGGYRFIGRRYARAGFVVVVAGYRLGREGAYPAMLEDGAAALRWVYDHAADYGGNPDRVFLMGHSAGAYNAAMLSLERQWLGRQGLPEGFVKGFIGLAGPYDFYPFTSDASRAAFGHVAEPGITQPVHFARGDAPPMLLLHGDQDITVRPRNSLALAKALTAAGKPTRAIVFTGIDHTAIVMKLAAPFDRDRRVADAVLAFLGEMNSALDSDASAAVQAKSR